MALNEECDLSCAKRLIDEEKFEDALQFAIKAVNADPQNAEAHIVKGIANFNMDRYENAKEAFLEGEKLDESNDVIKTWMRKCDAEIDLAKKTANDGKAAVGSSANSAESKQNSNNPVPMPAGPSTRYDWYQTDTHVIITLLVKNVQKERCHIDIQERTLSATIRLPSSSDYSLELDLAHAVDPNKSTMKILTSKVEVKLKKAEGIRWAKLEGEPENDIQQFIPSAVSTHKEIKEERPKYPSASKKDWDKIAAEVEDDKAEGDAALNQLFQKIYADGSDDVKKAMMKSFYESSGTVLSTNWNEVGKSKVDVKPPDGMEYKRFDS